MSRSELAAALRQMREAAGMTTDQASAALGRNRGTVEFYEAAIRLPKTSTLMKLAAIYGYKMRISFERKAS